MKILMLVEHVDSILMLCQFVLMSHIHIYIENMLFRRLESQYTGALERSQIIKDELILERQNNDELKCVYVMVVIDDGALLLRKYKDLTFFLS